VGGSSTLFLNLNKSSSNSKAGLYKVLVKGYKRDGSWVYTEWKLTVAMGWKQVVYAMNAMVGSVDGYSVFYGKSGCVLDDVTKEVKSAGDNLLRAGLMVKDSDILKIRGTISNIPIDITMRAEAEFMQVTFLNEGLFPAEDYVAIPWLYDTFGATLDKIELLGHLNYTATAIAMQKKNKN
jgi:hypothetical protein